MKNLTNDTTPSTNDRAGFAHWIRLARALAVAMLLLSQAACIGRSVQYEWTEHAIPPTRRADIFFVNPIPALAVNPAAADDSKYVIARSARYSYKSTNAVLTQALAEQLRHEFSQLGGSNAPDAEKGVVVEVLGAESSIAPRRSEIILRFKFTLGSGVTRELEVRNRTSASPGRAYDGVITLAVLEILQHPDFFNYLTPDETQPAG